MGAAGTKSTGAGSVAAVLAGATPWGPGPHVVSPRSGLTKAGVVGVLAAGVQLVGAEAAGIWSLGAPVVGVCGRMGCEGMTVLSGGHGAGLGLTKGDGGLLGRKSFALGTGPIDVSVSVDMLAMSIWTKTNTNTTNNLIVRSSR